MASECDRCFRITSKKVVAVTQCCLSGLPDISVALVRDTELELLLLNLD
jgi:hypothetical protein